MVSYPNQIAGPVTVTGGVTMDTSTVTGAQTVGSQVNNGNDRVTGTLRVTGVSSLNGGVNTANSANVIVPALANGVAAQLSDLTRDYMLYLEIGTAGTGFTLAIGPDASTANSVITSVTPVVGMQFTVRVPAGWFVKWAGTTTVLANQIAVGC